MLGTSEFREDSRQLEKKEDEIKKISFNQGNVHVYSNLLFIEVVVAFILCKSNIFIILTCHIVALIS